MISVTDDGIIEGGKRGLPANRNAEERLKHAMGFDAPLSELDTVEVKSTKTGDTVSVTAFEAGIQKVLKMTPDGATCIIFDEFTGYEPGIREALKTIPDGATKTGVEGSESDVTAFGGRKMVCTLTYVDQRSDYQNSVFTAKSQPWTSGKGTTGYLRPCPTKNKEEGKAALIATISRVREVLDGISVPQGRPNPGSPKIVVGDHLKRIWNATQVEAMKYQYKPETEKFRSRLKTGAKRAVSRMSLGS